MIDHLCPNCGAQYHSEEQHLGKYLKCGRCQTIFRIEKPVTTAADRSAPAAKTIERPQKPPKKSARTSWILASSLLAVAGFIWLASGPFIYTATLISGAALLILRLRDPPKTAEASSIWPAVRLQAADLALAATAAGLLLSLLQMWLQSSVFSPSDVATVRQMEVGIVTLRKYAGPLLSPGWLASVIIAIALLGLVCLPQLRRARTPLLVLSRTARARRIASLILMFLSCVSVFKEGVVSWAEDRQLALKQKLDEVAKNLDDEEAAIKAAVDEVAVKRIAEQISGVSTPLKDIPHASPASYKSASTTNPPSPTYEEVSAKVKENANKQRKPASAQGAQAPAADDSVASTHDRVAEANDFLKKQREEDPEEFGAFVESASDFVQEGGYTVLADILGKDESDLRLVIAKALLAPTLETATQQWIEKAVKYIRDATSKGQKPGGALQDFESKTPFPNLNPDSKLKRMIATVLNRLNPPPKPTDIVAAAPPPDTNPFQDLDIPRWELNKSAETGEPPRNRRRMDPLEGGQGGQKEVEMERTCYYRNGALVYCTPWVPVGLAGLQ